MLDISNNFKKSNKQKDEALINEAIRVREVRLVGKDGEQIGVIPTKQALDMAINENLDLVCVAPNAKPPVCRIMNYGKYRYEQQRKAREAKKNQKQVQVKEVRLTPVIEKHDFDTKLKRAIKFLEKGDKVKVSVYFRGRLITNKELGRKVLDNFVKACEEVATLEQRAKMEGKNLFITLAPLKK